MKKLNILLERMGLRKKKEPESMTMNLHLSAFSQEYVVNERMKEASLRHGDLVTADLSPVRIEVRSTDRGEEAMLYFCPLHILELKAFEEVGDGGLLPQQVNLAACKPHIKKENYLKTDRGSGLYTLKNVKIYSNGAINLISTPETELVPWTGEAW